MFAPSQLVEEDIEGDVVMVRLGDDEGGMGADLADEQGSTFMELKPSTTLLVPLELMEGQDGLVDGSQLALHELHQSDDPRSDSHSGFSLMLDMDEEMNKDADPIKNDVLLSEPAVLPPAVGASDELAGKPEVILLDADDSDAQLSGGASEEEQRRELDLFDGASGDGAVETKVQTQITETNHESEDAVEQLDAELARFEEDRKAAELLVCETGPADDPPVAVAESVAEENALKYEVLVEEDKMTTTEVKTTIIEQQEEPEENGPVIDTDIVSNTEMETVVGENQQGSTEVDNKEIQTETTAGGEERTDENKDVEEETPVSNSQKEEEPETEMLTSQRKKKAPSTPTRRTTRARTVTFTSPVLDEAEEPHGDGTVMETETSTLVPASPRRTPRKNKGKEVVQPITPRRSARKAQQEPPKEEAEERLETSKASSPARRQASQRASSTRSSQHGGQEASAATDGEIQAAPDDEITDTKSSAQRSSKSPTAARRRTTQGNTPRRSSRKMLNGSETAPAPLESLKEEKEQEEPPASPARRSTRKTKMEPPETQPAAPVDEEEKKQQVSSPSRATRQSNRNTLSVHQQVCIVSFLLTCKLSNMLKVPYHTKLHFTVF